MTKKVLIGNIYIGGGAPIAIQSMCNTKTKDIVATVKQINELEKAGCDIIRVAVPDMEAAKAIKDIKKEINIPLVADIHFDYKLAIESAKGGVDKLRINPGNIGERENVEAVANIAKDKGIPIRIGVNGGSVDRKKYPILNEESLVLSGMEQVKILESMGFTDIVLSIKSSSVPLMIKAYKLASTLCDYPLHLGVTEAGLKEVGTIKSAVGIGSLLNMGIGDTIRVSLTDDPIEEVYVAREILSALELREESYRFISCPTCGRTQIDLQGLAKRVNEYLRKNPPKRPITVAVMGCIVNGPGEAKEADIGVAGGKARGAIFKRGEFVRNVPESDMFEELVKEIELL
ncbi:MAG: flavodoxin-dependent (E)-4-hydroxy-3-methylbut-2-enyl-diphosphate synthase [Abditibacteriota bacterium]|nr:flavodoxin-dependent (E)-4-hydroxy-3-methylbut-2-enyl-diphosphate synthase [Abditibacteriota bacterium]